MGLEVVPSAKKPPEPRTEPRKRSVRWHFWWSMPIVPISFFFMFGILAKSGPNDYTRTYSLLEAFAETSTVPLSRMTTQPIFFLLPYALIVHVLGHVALQRRMRARWSATIAVGRLILTTGLPFTVSPLILAVLILPTMAFGATGETYSEGFVVGGAIGWWSLYQIAIFVRDMRPRVPVDGECPGCRYSREGLAADATCPECGLVPTVASQP
jgi:hypothetical protein